MIKKIQLKNSLVYFKNKIRACGPMDRAPASGAGGAGSTPARRTIIVHKEANPTIETLKKIAKALNIGVDELIK